MKVVQTPEEKGKKILAQQAQEQARFQQKLDEEEREEREKQRRLKEREGMAFLTYAKMRMEEEKARQESDKAFSNLLKDFYRQHTQQAMFTNRIMLNNLAQHDTAVLDSLLAAEKKEDLTKRKELLHSVNIDRMEYCALAMAGMCKTIGDKEDAEQVFLGKHPSERMSARRKECLLRTDEALMELGKGKAEKMETILKEGLLTACHAFSHTKDALCAIHWSKQINGILSVVSSHPVLFKNGPANPIFEAAIGMAALGRVMENGLKALDELCAAQMNGVHLSAEKEVNLQAQVLLMEKTDIQRSSEQFQKLFAKGYHPKKGLQQENLDNLLQKLTSSRAMYDLSAMDPEQKLFALSDAESRRTLSEDLFVRHTEITMEVSEPEMVKEAPALQH